MTHLAERMPSSEEFDFAALRAEMVEMIAMEVRLVSALIGRDRFDDRVMTTMASVPRHDFVPTELRELAYFNVPLPIGFGKTISQPFIVALMTELLEIDEMDAVLEIGTGLGYQAAILAKLADRVYTMEIIEELAQEARKRLEGLGYGHIEFRIGDGSRGWPEHAPYDKIIVAAAPETIPPMLLDQLKPGGRMILPVGNDDEQHLYLLIKGHDGQIQARNVLQVRFAPLVRSH